MRASRHKTPTIHARPTEAPGAPMLGTDFAEGMLGAFAPCPEEVPMSSITMAPVPTRSRSSFPFALRTCSLAALVLGWIARRAFRARERLTAKA